MTTTVITGSGLGRVRIVAPPLALAAWTLFTWVNRIRNISADPALVGGARLWSLAVAVTFTAAGLAVGALALAWARGRAPAPSEGR